jgi:hypothetical protein
MKAGSCFDFFDSATNDRLSLSASTPLSMTL